MAKNNRTINVLFVLDNLTIGGAQKLVVDIAKNLDSSRFRAFVCTLFSHEKIEDEPFADSLINAKIPLARLQLKSWRDVPTFWQFRRLLKDREIDVVHGHMIPADFWGCFATRLSVRNKAVYTRHNSYPINGLVSKIQLAVLNKFATKKIIVISRSIEKYVTEKTFAPSSKIELIYNGIDADRFNPEIRGDDVRRELGISQEEIVIGNISRYEPRKGYDVFIRTAVELVKRFPNVRFIACGHGPQKNELQKLTDDLCLGEKLILSDPRPDVENFIAAMDVFFFPTFWGEGLPLSVCEAMACGKPVVASNVGSNNELVTDGENGFLPDPILWKMETNDLQAEPFIEKIIKLIESPDLRNCMAKEGRARIEKFFNVKIMVQQHENIYLELMKKK